MSGFPQPFGPYVLLQPLAGEEVSALYVALSGTRETAKLCVIKIVRPELAGEGYVQRFKDEVNVAKRLSHRNLVGGLDSGQADGAIYLTMDFVEGRNLRAIWNRCVKTRTRIPLNVALLIVRDLARGLNYAHTSPDVKLVHRDVCPQKILLSCAGEVRLADFSMALSPLRVKKIAPGVVYGHVSYMSPEQARGESLDSRTDVYSAGIVLWELLTGRQLFPPKKIVDDALPLGTPGASQDWQSTELLTRGKNPLVPELSEVASWVPPELDSLVMRALRPDRSDRYQTCHELQLDLDRLLTSSSSPADAALLSAFLGNLFADDIEEERRERERLMTEALEQLPTRDPPRRLAVAAPIPWPQGPNPLATSKNSAGTDIFVSYAHQDRAIASALAEVFAKQGWSVWWDPHIPLGRLYDVEIERAVDGATCVVVLWSQTAIASAYVRAEAQAGLDRGVLVPVLLEEVRVPLVFRGLQGAMLTGWRGDDEHPELAKVLRHITALVGGVRAPTSPGASSASPANEAEDRASQFQAAEPVSGSATGRRPVTSRLPFAISTELADGGASPILEKDAPLPTHHSEIFSTAQENQTSVQIVLAAGANPIFKKNYPLGRFGFDGLPAAPRGVPQIEMTISVNTELVLMVTAEDKANGRKKVLGTTDLTRFISAIGAADLARLTTPPDKTKEIVLTAAQAAHGLPSFAVTLAGGRTVEVVIPAGVTHGDRLRLRGCGSEVGADGQRTDLILPIQITG